MYETSVQMVALPSLYQLDLTSLDILEQNSCSAEIAVRKHGPLGFLYEFSADIQIVKMIIQAKIASDRSTSVCIYSFIYLSYN